MTSCHGNTCHSTMDNPLQWHNNGCDSVSIHQLRECWLSRLIRRRSKKTSKFRVTGLCAGNSPETGEFPAQRASNAENVSIWWGHHAHWPFPCIAPILCAFLREKDKNGYSWAFLNLNTLQVHSQAIPALLAICEGNPLIIHGQMPLTMDCNFELWCFLFLAQTNCWTSSQADSDLWSHDLHVTPLQWHMHQ